MGVMGSIIYAGGVLHYLKAGRGIFDALLWPSDLGRRLAEYSNK